MLFLNDVVFSQPFIKKYLNFQCLLVSLINTEPRILMISLRFDRMSTRDHLTPSNL